MLGVLHVLDRHLHEHEGHVADHFDELVLVWADALLLHTGRELIGIGLPEVVVRNKVNVELEHVE